MAVKKPTYERFNFPKKQNHELTWEYLTSKSTTRRIPKVVENGDNIDRSIDISYYLASKELCKTDKLLSDKRKVFLTRRKQLDEAWAELTEKEEGLRQSFIEYDKFITENHQKRERSKGKIAEQEKLIKDRVAQIESVKDEYGSLAEMKKLMDEKIAQYRIYENFLRDVVEAHPREFKTVQDVLNRYDELLHAEDELITQQMLNLIRLTKARMFFDDMIEKRYVKISGLKIKVAALNERYETARLNCQKWENVHQNIVSEAMKKMAVTVAIKDSCWQIYKEICERKKIEPVFKDDYGKQFDFIKKALFEFECVNRMVRDAEEEKLRLSEKPCVSSGTE